MEIYALGYIPALGNAKKMSSIICLSGEQPEKNNNRLN